MLYLCLFGLFTIVHSSSVSNDIETQATNGKVLICYYSSWASYRNGNGKLDPDQIDPNICTHLIYAFAGLGADNTIISLDAWNDLSDGGGKDGYKKFTDLKQRNPNLKTLLAIGGWNEGESNKYSNMASNDQSRKTFVDSVVKMLEKYNFDGLDLDWEYPVTRNGMPSDKENFIKLISDLKNAFTPKGYILTAAVRANDPDSSYDIPNMSNHLDFINLMAYDFHIPSESTTGHNSPLYDQNQLNVNSAVEDWINRGVNKEKLVLGIAAYGHTFTLANAQSNGFNAQSSGPGLAGPYTQQQGSLGYNEFCEQQTSSDKWTIVQDDEKKVPYAFRGNQWFGYDDTRSAQAKASYSSEKGLGGAMIYSIETDDLHGLCGEGNYPLANSIKRGLGI